MKLDSSTCCSSLPFLSAPNGQQLLNSTSSLSPPSSFSNDPSEPELPVPRKNLMSSAISSSLQAQGRSAYRHVLRSSRVVFKGSSSLSFSSPSLALPHSEILLSPFSLDGLIVKTGDPKALSISHQKLREAYELEANRSESDPAKYEERINMAKQVGDILLKNVVQGEKKADSDVYGSSLVPSCPSLLKQKRGGERMSESSAPALLPFLVSSSLFPLRPSTPG